jgi:hypothetical protein
MVNNSTKINKTNNHLSPQINESQVIKFTSCLPLVGRSLHY